MNNRFNFQSPKIFRIPQNGDVINYKGRLYFIGEIIDNGSFAEVYECEDEWGNLQKSLFSLSPLRLCVSA